MRFFKRLQGQKMNDSLVNGVVQENPETFCTQGCVQPMPQNLVVKMEGERHWKWWIIDCYPNLWLEVNDRVIINNIPYRIMRRNDCTNYGYLEYHAIEDYQDIE